jgi:hypothetical protein
MLPTQVGGLSGNVPANVWWAGMSSATTATVGECGVAVQRPRLVQGAMRSVTGGV